MKNSSLSFSLSNISQEALLHHRNYRFLLLASNGFDSKLVVVVVVLFVCLFVVCCPSAENFSQGDESPLPRILLILSYLYL